MLYYLGYYCAKGNPQNRNCVLSATNKMDYIINAIADINVEQTVVSCAVTKSNRFYRGFEQELDNGVKLKQLTTFGRKNILTKLADFLFIKPQLIVYLLTHVKKNDVVLAYHSPFYCKVLKYLRKIKRFRLILEVEELYSDVSGNERLKKRELAVCRAADAFVFPTKMLSDAVNLKNKPYAVIHGTYEVESSLESGKIFEDKEKIHCVYAGTLDPRKGGAAAAAAALFLTADYHIHILGFGTEGQINDIKKIVSETAEKSKATVTYDGLLSGEEYIRFIQSCDIGLSTQNPDAAFNATSFPSKILSYMANGLRVVSIKIPAIEGSAIGDYMYYYENQTPEEIAKAIMAVDMDDGYDGRKIIGELDREFVSSIDRLLKEIQND